MTLNQKIIAALSPLGRPVVPNLYTGSADQYFTFNYSIGGAFFANDAPAFDECFVQVHFFCPHSCDSVAIREAARKSLFAAGFTWPVEISVDDGLARKNDCYMQHYVFECEIERAANPDG